MAGVPVPVITGTIVFVLIALAFAVCAAYLRRSGRLDKDSSQIFCVSIVVGTVCLWIMWVCTWLHQWHPIIYPIVAHQPGATVAPSGGASGGGHR